MAKRSHPAAPAPNLRATAVNVIAAVVFQQIKLDQALAAESRELNRISSRDIGLIKALCFGCLRDWWRLIELSQRYLKKPIRRKDRVLEVVLVLGIHQLLSMRVPDHAALNQTVAVLDAIDMRWAKAMVNAVLRAVQRDRDSQVLQPAHSREAQFNHPAWLLERIQQDWPQQAQQIYSANNQQAAMDLRCNRLHWTRAQALAALQQADIAADEIVGVESGVRLRNAHDVSEIPQFLDGGFSVQDAAAQLAAPLIDVHDGMRVLDACAAPGGKTAHLLETQPNIELLAIDIEPARVALIQDNLQRLHLTAGNCRTAVVDASLDPVWWDGRPYQRILLDAPCSASGVIRRHPDIKLLRQAEDINRLSQQQLRILQQLWPLVQSGGMLLYVTCSILRQENDDVIKSFIDAEAGSVLLQPLQLPWGRATAFGWQILPGDKESDGFYYACLQKRDTAS